MRNKGYSKNPEITRMEEKVKLWYECYKSPRKEQQVFELLKTSAGQDFVRKELNMNFEFGTPMLKSDIELEYKWALTLMLAKYCIVPTWQKILRFPNDWIEYEYMGKQRSLLQESGCDTDVLTSILDFTFKNGLCSYSSRNSERYKENKAAARRIRESNHLNQALSDSRKVDRPKGEWFFDHVDDDCEQRILEQLSKTSKVLKLASRFADRFEKNNIKKFSLDTWRRDERRFFYKWFTVFEMAEMGKIPSWQVDWTPEYRSDYCCFIEQIRILEQFGHDPWPLLQQLPADPPTKYRTLEDVLFEK